ncbi:MAG: hypothetical protein PHO48_02175 [Candidatus Gracilibacteria bacterium]|nr:hypothetical protein [Candidatus Gracilibacteria bacterium]MDD5178863.1 hypothetical protein [Candidatus Gracilibacteria bacterium]
MVNKFKKAKFYFGVIGIILIIFGWFVDESEHFKFLNRLVCQNCVKALDALDYISLNSRFILLPKNEGFDVLVKSWPDLKDKKSVVVIARSVMYQSFNQNIKKAGNNFQLIAYNDNCALFSHSGDPIVLQTEPEPPGGCGAELRPRLEESEARKLFASVIKTRLFFLGSFVFFVGILIDFSLRVLEGRDIFSQKQKL